MNSFTHPEFAGHERVVFVNDKSAGLQAIIAVHNTQRGPAIGGCRMWPYESPDAALTDVLRLSRGMTYKMHLQALAVAEANQSSLEILEQIRQRHFSRPWVPLLNL